ncbi:MAG: MFS transporter [Thiomonas sp.]|uniref:MFS transporter n=1 Tax=Thiomonas sp. TaxID=2047785 RepID=UPI002A368670|nr:MFS transporter [Thiomonas sp.]MDY0329280.1 MFS transporter [Thiomonas sp.]
MPSSPPPSDPQQAPLSVNQFKLLGQRRFAPFFWTQFTNAGNDNLLKFAFTMLVTYRAEAQTGLPAGLMVNLIAALYVLPFVLLSATAGQLADKCDMGVIMRRIKSFEIVIMLGALWGFVTVNVPLLLVCVLGMGLHSTLFGPVKFAYLPRHLHTAELTGGNGMTEMGGFVAILLGSLVGGVLMTYPQGPVFAGATCLAISLAGWTMARFVPRTPSLVCETGINWNPFTATARSLRLAAADRSVLAALIAIAWMWFYGVAFLTQFPIFTREVVHGSEAVASLLLVIFAVGIGLGSVACEWMAHGRVEIGLVLVGAIGMSVFGVDLFVATRHLPHNGQLQTLTLFLREGVHWRLMVDLLLISASAGIYSVPLYAFIQHRVAETHRARVIAASNMLNALFMIACAAYCATLLTSGVGVPMLLLTVALFNALMLAWLVWKQPIYGRRFIAWVLRRKATTPL